MKKQKLSLDQLKVKSFVTTDQKQINGGEGSNETLPTQLICVAETEGCLTQIACNVYTLHIPLC